MIKEFMRWLTLRKTERFPPLETHQPHNFQIQTIQISSREYFFFFFLGVENSKNKTHNRY